MSSICLPAKIEDMLSTLFTCKVNRVDNMSSIFAGKQSR